jgi:hypothetical protein
VARVQQKFTSGTATSSSALSVTWTQNTAAGNCGLLHLAISEWNVAGTVAEDAGTPDLTAQGWTLQSASSADGAREALFTYVKANLAASESAVSVTLPSATGARTVLGSLIEESGIATSSPVDVEAAAFNDSTAATFDSGATGSTSQASEKVYAALVQQFEPPGTVTPTSEEGWSDVASTTAGISQEGLTLAVYEKTLTATGTVQFSGGLSPSRRWAAAVTTLKAATAPPDTTTGRFAPDAILAATGLTGAVSAIQDDPDSPDGNWLTA